MERRNGYDRDFDWGELLGCVFVVFIMLLIVGVFTALILAGEAKTSRDSQQSYNARVEKFNNLPQSDRIAISGWLDYEVDENYLLAPEPAPRTFREWLWVVAPYAGILAAIALSAFIFWWYARNKPKRYFFADLPLKGMKGAICVVLLWLFWLVLLVSLIRMKRWEAQQKAEATGESQDEIATEDDDESEDQTPEMVGDDKNGYVTYEDRSIDRTRFAGNAYEQFEHYYQQVLQQAYKDKLRAAELDVENAEESLAMAGEEVRRYQKSLKEAKLRLRQLLDNKASLDRSDITIKDDWEAIKQLRGVVAVYYDDDKSALMVDVEVRVPYDGEVYDFGDYTITVSDDRVVCFCTRSGIRDDWEMGDYPDYRYGDGTFCLGDRKGTIGEYLRRHQVREALILTVDCLHSVNNEEHAEDIPHCFRKIVSSKEE